MLVLLEKLHVVWDVKRPRPEGTVDEHDEVVLGRHAFGRAEPAGRLAFVADFICNINWADSGPGMSWPEAYHVFRVPGFDRYVVTASREVGSGRQAAESGADHHHVHVTITHVVPRPDCVWLSSHPPITHEMGELDQALLHLVAD